MKIALINELSQLLKELFKNQFNTINKVLKIRL